MLRLTLRQIEYVVAIADCGSLTEAAARLNLSQPSLSVAVAQVEALVGMPLFHRRRGARIVPTAGAPDFLRRAREVLALAATLEDPAALGRAAEGRLRIGCFRDLAPVWLPRAMAVVRAALPGVEVVPVTADFARLAEDLREGRIDIALSYDLGLDATVERVVLAQAVPHVFVPPGDPLAGRDAVRLADLADRPLILFEEGLSVRHMLRLLQGAGVRPVVRHRVATLEILRSLAAHGEGVGISYSRPPGDVTYDGAQVVARPIVDAAAREPVVLVRTAGGVAPHIDRAVAAMTAAAR